MDWSAGTGVFCPVLAVVMGINPFLEILGYAGVKSVIPATEHVGNPTIRFSHRQIDNVINRLFALLLAVSSLPGFPSLPPVSTKILACSQGKSEQNGL